VAGDLRAISEAMQPFEARKGFDFLTCQVGGIFRNLLSNKT
jgi:hypothetical protein